MSAFHCSIRHRHYSFPDLKAVLAKATPERSGDHLAGVAAETAEERVAARYLLADLPLRIFLEPEHAIEKDAFGACIEEFADDDRLLRSPCILRAQGVERPVIDADHHDGLRSGLAAHHRSRHDRNVFEGKQQRGETGNDPGQDGIE